MSSNGVSLRVGWEGYEIRRAGKLRRVVVLILMVVLGLGGVSWSAMGDKSWEWETMGYAYLYSFLDLDSEGNLLVAYPVIANSTNYYAHVISLDRNGGVNWETDVSDPSGKFALSDLTVDKDDNVIVGGSAHAGGDYDWKVVKLSSSGSALREFSYDSGYDDYLYALATDSQGRIVGVGRTDTSSSSSSSYRGVVNFLSVGKVVEWPPLPYSEAEKVVVDSNDRVVVMGSTYSGGDRDWKVVSYSYSGTKLWEESFDGGYGEDSPEDLAVDDSGNVVVVGSVETSGGDDDWMVVFYEVSGATATLKWDSQIDGEGGEDRAYSVVVDDAGNVVVGGFVTMGGNEDGLLIYYDPSFLGRMLWSKRYDESGRDEEFLGVDSAQGMVVAVGTSHSGSYCRWKVRAYSVVDGSLKWENSCAEECSFPNDIVVDAYGGTYVVGVCGVFAKVKVVAYEGVTTPDSGGGTGGDTGGDNGTDNGTGGGTEPLTGHVLRPSEVRTINSPPRSPSPLKGTYLGFGEAAVGGSNFKLQAAFPQYINVAKNQVYEVKIFIAAQLPDDYSRLLYITSANEVMYQPPERLSSWKSKVKGFVPNTVVLNTSSASMPSGLHYWYTLVVPSYVPDDFSGVDWSTLPWEVTVNVLNLP